MITVGVAGKEKQSRVKVIANHIMQKLYSAADVPGGFACIGSGEDSSVEKVDQTILSILHFQFTFALGLDEYISK